MFQSGYLMWPCNFCQPLALENYMKDDIICIFITFTQENTMSCTTNVYKMYKIQMKIESRVNHRILIIPQMRI